MKIVVFAEGGSNIGMGHLMRISVLLDSLDSKNIYFLMTNKKDVEKGKKWIIEKGYQLIEYTDCLPDVSGDILLTDHYFLPENYFVWAKDHFKIHICMDDNNLLEYYPVDLLINQNFGSEFFTYHTLKNTGILLGTDYFLLRKEFRNKNPFFKQNLKNIMITLGGGDKDNLTKKILEILYPFPYHFHVVLGNAYLFDNSLTKFYDKSNITFYRNPNMADLMDQMNLAITACGTTIYELMYMQVPMMGIITADNQVKSAISLHEKGHIYNCGFFNEKSFIDDFTFITNNEAIRKKLVCQIIDNQGHKRILYTLNKILIER